MKINENENKNSIYNRTTEKRYSINNRDQREKHKKAKKKVSFGTVKIKYYERDNDEPTEQMVNANIIAYNSISTKNRFECLTPHDNKEENTEGNMETEHHSNKKQPESQRKYNHRRKKKKQQKNINLLYANTNGVLGKIDSLITAARTTEAHIICLAETKLGQTPPDIPKYTWKSNHYRKTETGGGGVGILVREDIKHLIEPVDEELENHDQEIAWVKLKQRTNIYIGIFYGPQEKCSNEEAQRQYSQITSQINKLSRRGEVILAGDFNAKLQINTEEIQQNMSKNGKYMQNMIDHTGLRIPSLEINPVKWTRVKRKDNKERSIIDYVLMSNRMAQSTKRIEIDDIGLFRLKGKEESDHNSILVETSVPYTSKIEKKTIYNMKDKRKWPSFNTKLAAKYEDKPPENYNEFEIIIKETIEETFKKISITTGEYKPKLSKEIKNLKVKKREDRKAFEKANRNEKATKLDQYVKTQIELKTQLEQHEKEIVEKRIKKIIQEGGVKSDSFWKIRKRIMNKSKPDEAYDTITEDGITLTDPEEAKEYIANYYETLYQAREGTVEYAEWTDSIKQKVKDIEENINDLQEEPPFIPEELITVIKSLKPGKAPGPDGIPNELLKRANEQTLPIYLEEMNKILKNMEIPPQWTEGDLKRLYKGKGKKGKCSNERGITLASNIGKTFERLVNNRIIPLVNMSDAQAGGIKGRATVDHILILKEMIHISKLQKQETLLTYLDVTKAYDKAWLDAIMYVLHKQGVKTPIWLVVKRLNSNLKTTIQTKHGPTRQINIKDSIRQGGVLSVILYALLMDEISKDIHAADIGINIPNTECKVPCLLWMDDVVLIEQTCNIMQNLLDITRDTSQKYHIEFGMPKTNYLRTSKKKDTIELKLGDNIIKETEKYAYLGEINNKRMNLKDQLLRIEGKVEAAYQTLIAVAEDRHFKGIKMESIWKLVKACIIPIITYACETWEPNKQEMKKLNQILDKILRRILMTPDSTPREALYIETGLLDIETIMDIKRINMMSRLTKERSILMNNIINNPECRWKKKTKEVMEKYNITQWELAEEKEFVKTIVKYNVHEKFKEKMIQNPENKSKIAYFLERKEDWKPEKPAEYMNKLTRKQTSTIFKIRTRMTRTKANYKNGYINQTCRACNVELETQQHILKECIAIHLGANRIELDPFTEDTNKLKIIAKEIDAIVDRLEKKK